MDFIWPEGTWHWVGVAMSASAFLLIIVEMIVRYVIVNGKAKKPGMILVMFVLGTRGTMLAHALAMTSLLFLVAGLGKPLVTGFFLWTFYSLQERRFKKLVFGILSKLVLCIVVLTFMLNFNFS